ncbi:MAG: putative transcriptional regulator [bacterium]|nr:MAG: putative transcriptional regulator [bacterium]
MAEKADKTQNTISRLEDPSYGKLTIKTLLELASSFDVALLIKFVPFSDFLNETQALSAEALSAKSFTEELRENETLQLIEQQIQSTKVIIGSFGVDTHIKQTISVTTQTIQQPPQQAQLASTKIVEVGNKQNISLKTITA